MSGRGGESELSQVTVQVRGWQKGFGKERVHHTSQEKTRPTPRTDPNNILWIGSVVRVPVGPVAVEVLVGLDRIERHLHKTTADAHKQPINRSIDRKALIAAWLGGPRMPNYSNQYADCDNIH